MLMRLLRTHLRPYRGVLAVVVVLQVVQTTATLVLPTITADLIDKGVIPGDVPYIWSLAPYLALFAVVQIVFAVGAVRFGARAAMSFGRDLRNGLFHQVTGFSAREVGTFGAPSLITRITNDVQQVQLLVVMGCTMMIAAPITMVVGIIFALREDVGLSVVLLVSMPAAIVILGFVVSRMVPAFQAMQVRIDEVNRVLREQITGVRVVRAFAREPDEGRRFAAANAALTGTSLQAGRLMAAMFPTVTLIINVSSIGVLWVGADRIGDGTLEIGSLIAYLTYLIQILIAVVMATFMISMVPRAAVAAARIQEVLDTETSVVVRERPVTEVHGRGHLEVRDVSFGYPGAASPVLCDISFTTGPGRTTAIIGSTGSGKSTLVGLIPRLFDVTEGAVLVDGVDVRDLDPDVLWSRVGVVPQKPYLFSGTVASNLRYGKTDATDAEMWAALEIAQAADFVRLMPEGLDSSIAQGGANVSGGQRQRLAIARALVLRPGIYVFDDSFSALDLTTDARLRAALAPSTADAAKVIVAQRVATIAEADEILVLEDGRVVGAGTHDELLDACPTYLEIVESQTGRRQPA